MHLEDGRGEQVSANRAFERVEIQIAGPALHVPDGGVVGSGGDGCSALPGRRRHGHGRTREASLKNG